MLKKYLLAGVVIVTTTAAYAAPRSTFMNGLSGGMSAGYQANKIPDAKALGYNSPTAGLHIDYNRIISSTVFLGSGLEFNYAFAKGKKYLPDILNASDIRTLTRTFTALLTLRGGIVSGRIAYELNGSLILTKWKTQGKDIVINSFTRYRSGFTPGFAPGFAVTVALDEAKKMSIGVGYRYEIYPKSHTANPPALRYNAHVAVVKFNFHF